MFLLNLLPHLLNGITLGLLFALIALGFMLILGLMEQINLAHGSLFALGAYFAYAICAPRLPLPPDILALWAGVPLGWRFAAAVILAPVLVAPFGLVLERLMRRTYGRDPLYGLLLTFGVAMVLEELIRMVWGTRDYLLPVPREMSGGFIMLDLIWSTYRFWAAALAIAAMAGVWVIVERTRFGAMVKAGAHDSEIVQALGIDLTRLRVWVFVLGTMLAAFAGVIMAPLWGIRPSHGRRRGGAGVSHHRARRRRQFLGRRHRRNSGRHGGRPVGRLRVRVVDALDVSVADRRRHVPRPRAVRQEEHPGGLIECAGREARIACRTCIDRS